jgi:uncharacterized membrane protein YkoI
MGRLTILGVGFAAAAAIATAGGIALADDHHIRPVIAAGAHDDHGDDSTTDRHHHDDTAAATSTRISAAQARKIAQRAVPGARITSTELHNARRTPTWEIELTAKGIQRELTIDARTGKITKNEARRASRGRQDDHPGRDDHHGDH